LKIRLKSDYKHAENMHLFDIFDQLLFYAKDVLNVKDIFYLKIGRNIIGGLQKKLKISFYSNT